MTVADETHTTQIKRHKFLKVIEKLFIEASYSQLKEKIFKYYIFLSSRLLYFHGIVTELKKRKQERLENCLKLSRVMEYGRIMTIISIEKR